MPQMTMIHSKDPRDELLEEIAQKGVLDGIQITYSQVLIAIYKRPEKTKGGLYIPEQARDEDRYQGKAGLVVQLGALAFQNTETVDFHGFSVKVGDWVVIRPSDGWPVGIRGLDFRVVSDAGIRMVIDSPDAVW